MTNTLVRFNKDSASNSLGLFALALLFAGALTVSPAFGVTFGPDDFANEKKTRTYRGERFAVPAGHPSGAARLEFVCRGPVSLTGISVVGFDAKGKIVSRNPLWPSVKMPCRAEWGKPCTHMMQILPSFYDAKAVKVALQANLTHQVAAGSESPVFELTKMAVEWCGMPHSDKAGNWCALGEEVTFRGTPPEGKTGFRVSVTDDRGAAVLQETVKGAVWRWKPATAGFFWLTFDWLDDAGNATRAVGSFACGAFDTEDGVAVRRKFAEFPRDRQAFAVSPTPARDVKDAPPMFGFNVSPSTVLRLGSTKNADPSLPFRLVKLLGMSSFIRYHRFNWQDIEAKGRGQYNWSSVDRGLKIAKENGYGLDRILVNTFGTPTWLSSAPAGIKPGPRNRIYSYAPKDMAPWHDFIKAFVARYPDMKYLELWNEPHLPGYSVFWMKSSPQQFLDLMKAGYTGAKEANPNIVVLMGGQGMRYEPFYDEYVKLGGVKWYDQLDTHCGYNMQHFRAVERRHGAESKPYWEGEWHTVLYNCSTPKIPSEETCAYRMLTNMADLMNEGYERITGFGLLCGNHTPETARFFAKGEGINQVAGLFRNLPFEEPRLAAFALRTATDRFAGEIKRLGAWAFAEDGSQRLAAFTSDRGAMAFVWSANPNMKKGGWTKAMRKAIDGKRILDWAGRTVRPEEMACLRVYFVEEPDLAAAAKGGTKVEHLDFITYNYKKPKNVMRGVYASLESPVWNTLSDGKARFAADLGKDALELEVRSRAGTLKELVFAVDVTSKGLLDDVAEFKVSSDGTIVKLRTPPIMGDIPVDFSRVGVPLVKSTAVFSQDAGESVWKVRVAMSDLYPFIPTPNRQVNLFLRATDDKGVRVWGGGWEKIKKPEEFGQLRPGGGNRVIAEQKEAAVEGKEKLTVHAKFQPGSVVRAVGLARGNCRILLKALPRDANGHALPGIDAIGPANRRGIDATDEWQPFDWRWEMPADATRADFRFFFWNDPQARFEIKDLKLINE